MGFEPVLDDGLVVTYLRRDSELGVCVVVLDSRSEEIGDEEVIQNLYLHRISLADFWNLYDATGEP